jgi:D-alanyl-D-alanine dipeptidase
MAALLAVVGCGTVARTTGPALSPARTMHEAGMVDIRTLVPDIAQDMRYFGSDNFVGAPVDGYLAPRCWLKREAAAALARVEARLRQHHQRLQVFDCYRPARAVAHFMRWAADSADQRTKAAYYPTLPKSALVGEYIAPVSGHSRGATVDLTLLQCDGRNAACKPLDMGTDFDYFGTRANTDSPDIDATQRANRQRLREAMAAAGFHNYPLEWWHYTFRPEPGPDTIYDVPVSSPDASRDAVIDGLMQRYDGDVPGASLLVVEDGRALVARGYGRADLEAGIEAGPATHYRLGACGRSFTTAAILLLAQEGQLTLDAPLQRFLQAHAPVPLRQSGLLASGEYAKSGEAADQKWRVSEVASARALGDAGRDHRDDFAILARVVERVSGLAYPDFMRRRIFQPLAMHDTLVHVGDGPAMPHLARGYRMQGGAWHRSELDLTGAAPGVDDIHSTIQDLARWEAALYADRLLPEAARVLLLGAAPMHADNGVDDRVDTWRISETSGRADAAIGFAHAMVRWPQQRLTAILLSNRTAPVPDADALAIGRLFL